LVVVFPHPAVYRSLGQAHLAHGETARAEVVFRRGTDRFPDDRLLALATGDALALLGDRDGALEQWRRAGVTAGYMAARGLTFAPPGRSLDATARWEFAAALWPDSSNAWFELAAMYLNSSDPRLGIVALERAIAVDSWNRQPASYASRPHAYFYLGLMRMNSGNSAGAYPDLLAALELGERQTPPSVDPSPAFLHKLLGIVSLNQGNGELALAHLRAAEALGATGSEMQYLFGLARGLVP
jgi:tetratricopeptide (TPR) repeat protein